MLRFWSFFMIIWNYCVYNSLSNFDSCKLFWFTSFLFIFTCSRFETIVAYFGSHYAFKLTVWCRNIETSSMRVGHSRVVVKSQTTSGSVAAVEAILEVKPRFADHIIWPHKIMVQNSDEQFCFQREGHCEFKHPERKCKACCESNTRPVRVQGINAGGLGIKYWLSKRRVELLGDVPIFGIQSLLSNADQQIWVRFTIQVLGSQISGL